MMTRVTSYYIHDPPVIRREVVSTLSQCVITCIQTNGCYYVIISKETGTSRLCDITSVWEASGLVFSDEEDHDWEVYTVF